MGELVIRVPGEPVPQNQGKVGRWKAKDGREGVTVRQPAHVRHYKVDLQERMYRAAVDTGHWPPGHVRGSYFGAQPLALEILAVFELPASRHRKRTPVQRQLHTGRYGNCDNLTKAIGDAGEAVLWDDDGQIAELHVRKFWGAQGEAPFVEIRARTMSIDLMEALRADLNVTQPPAAQPALQLEEEKDVEATADR